MLAGVICVTFVGCGRTGVNAVETTEQETEAVLETETTSETESVAGTDEEQTDATGSISVSNESYSMNGWSISFEVRNNTDKTINKIEPVFVMTAQVGNLEPSGTFEPSSQDGVYVFSIDACDLAWDSSQLNDMNLAPGEKRNIIMPYLRAVDEGSSPMTFSDVGAGVYVYGMLLDSAEVYE